MKLTKGSWLITIPMAATALGLVVFAILPAHRTNRGLKKEISDKQQFLAGASQLAALTAATQESLKKLDAFVQSFAGSSGQQDRSALYAKITDAARNAGLVTTRFDPRPPQPGVLVTRLPMHLTGTGSFTQIAQFLYEIESMPMSIWVENIELKRTAEAAQSVQFEASLVVFVVNSEKSG
jgi:Tfp pilus assembly protein PilO